MTDTQIPADLYDWNLCDGFAPVLDADRADVLHVFAEHLSISAREGFGETLLHRAAARGAVECAKALISLGLDVNARDFFGRSPLHHAIEKSDDRLALVLIEAGADVNRLSSKNDDQKSPLREAALARSPECVQILSEAGARLETVHDRHALAFCRRVLAIIEKYDLEEHSAAAAASSRRRI